MDVFKNFFIKLTASGFFAVIAIYFVSLAMIVVFGGNENAKTAMSTLQISGTMVYFYMMAKT